MRSPLSFLFLLPLLVDAAQFKVKKVKRSHLFARQSSTDGQVSVPTTSEPGSISLGSHADLLYFADILVGGQNYTVQLDTGSSDLWISPPNRGAQLPNVTYTDATLNLTYVLGYAAGNISFAPVEFVGLPVTSQALLATTDVKNSALEFGAQGIAGLGFTSRSVIDLTLNKTNAATGRSLLYNLFQVHPDELNFIAFALHRTTDGSGDEEGSFSIGEYDPEFVDIAGRSRIDTWPKHNPLRWNVLLDSLIIYNNETRESEVIVPESRLPNTPSNKAVILLDSGASYTFCPESISTTIYSKIPGASFNAGGYWVVPCNAEVNMAMQIGGQVFPLHPLDVVSPRYPDPSECIGSFIPMPAMKEYDWLVGDNFLRSVYSLYDFGDFDENGNMGDPYVKLLSVIGTPDQASAEFAQTRGTTPQTGITYVGLDGDSIDPMFSVSKDISDNLELIAKFIPAMLGIVALNAVVVLACGIFWIISFCKKRRNKRSPREPRGRTTPALALTPRNSYIPGTPPSGPHVYEPVSPHVYEPVSMALTEDTFVPPSPAFHRREGSKLSPGDRPKSVA